MKTAFRHTAIPAYWLEFVLQEKMFRDAQILVVLKSKFGATCYKKSECLKFAASAIGVSGKTVSRSFNRLVSKNYIGVCKHTGRCYFRSWTTIMKMDKLVAKRSYWFDVQNIARFKSFVIAACVTNLIKSQKKAVYLERQEKGRRVQSRYAAFPVSVRAFSKVHNLEHTTAYDYLNLAVAEGWLTKKCKRVRLNVPEREVDHTKYYNGEGKIIRSKGKVYINLPNRYLSKLETKKRRIG